MSKTKGKVFLIGAGPGDPGLLTLKAKECIEQADVVIYDYLANKDFLEYARKEAEIIYAGKQGGDHTLTQDKINALIVKKSSQGKIIARLKGGDPFIFGRGGEEAEELLEDNIPFEIVSGVTSAIAVPAYAGIPLTHRDYTATVAFITGHEDPTKKNSNIQWDKISTGVGTLVFFMGVKNLPLIIQNLITHGRSPQTPIALIRWGTTLNQKTVTGTLENIVQKVAEAKLKPPSIIVVGEVVNLREKLNWFEKKPLFGKKIMVTRARSQASDFVNALKKQGASIYEFPTIETVPPKSWKKLDQAIKKLDSYDWIIFTSANGVKYFLDRLDANNKDIRELKGLKICAIGPKTAEIIQNLRIKVDLIPSEYRAEEIITGLKKKGIKGKNILIPRAMVAREILPADLKKAGAKVTVVDAYQTITPKQKTTDVRELFKEKKVDAVTFTSSSTVKNFIGMFGKKEYLKLLDGVLIFAIGPITAQTIKENGLKPDFVSSVYTIEGFTSGIVDFFSKGE